jgi:hypothetical protein
MRHRLAPLFVLVLIGALAAVVAAPAGATPSKNSTCTSCHSGAASGAVTATPSNASPAPGATYTVNLSIGLTSSGDSGYHVAQTDAAGTATTWMSVSGGPGAQTTWTPSMTAPATPGTYYYKVWTAKGYSGTAKAATYSITVPAPAATAAITTLTPNHARTGVSVVIAGSNLGASGTVRFGATTATTTAWSATSVTATVPASLATGATTVTVMPSGGSASNALAFTVDAPAPLADTTAPVTVSGGVPVVQWCNYAVTVSLTATDNAGGSGVASITYAVDGGAPVTVAGAATSVPLGASGAHSVAFFAKDVAGNAETVKSVSVNIDTSKPQPRASRAAKVRHTRTATLRYRILDEAPNGGSAGVTIAIRNRRGKVVKRMRFSGVPVNTPLKATFRCSLRPGTYRFVVSATDAAGNPQATVATQKLTVLGR